jgi:signal transduction histidine kinase
VGSSLFQVADSVTRTHWRALLIAMLVLLHVAALRGTGDIWARAFMVAHFGLFIIWQPFMQGARQLNLVQTIGIALITAAILLFLNAWVLALWVAMLAGLVGGKVFLFQARWLRVFYLTVLLYLVLLLLVWVVPSGFPGLRGGTDFETFAQYGLPVMFLVLAVLPVESDTAEPQIVDFFYAVLIFLLLAALVLGSFAFMTVGGATYAFALIYTLLVIGGVMFFLSLAWNPRAGFSGLSMFFSRYLLSIGLPFEQWLHFLSDLSRTESQPDEFLRKACGGLSSLGWVTGGTWQGALEKGEFGTPTAHSVEYAGRDVQIRLYSRHKTSPSLVWHFNLLGQLIAQFHLAKQRELKLQQQTYVQALHETGARMTHDVKNLLQSLNVLCSAAERGPETDPAAFNALVRRHLPIVTQRLQLTLDKLQKPQLESGRYAQAASWWDQARRLYQARGLAFAGGDGAQGVLLPKDLFDSALENLIQNALEKRKLDPRVELTVALECGDALVLRVCDTGRPVTEAVLRGLLRGPVPSETGYGIGLYQVARQAEASGFEFELVANEAGRVCFELRGQLRGAARAEAGQAEAAVPAPSPAPAG